MVVIALGGKRQLSSGAAMNKAFGVERVGAVGFLAFKGGPMFGGGDVIDHMHKKNTVMKCRKLHGNPDRNPFGKENNSEVMKF